MDTQKPSTSEAPTFKLAKVGKERKRGGAWFGGGRGAGSGLRLMGGGGAGSGVGMGSSAVAAKIMTIFLVSAVASFGSSRLSAVLRADSKPKAAAEKRAFMPKNEVAQKYDDLSGVIKGENTIPNSMGFISGSVDGLTPEERAKKAADAAAAQKAEEEAQKKADEEAAKQSAMPGGMPVDAAALMAGAAGKKDGKPELKNFNKLSSKYGGSAGGSHLSGGAGLSGGVSRGFVAPTGAKGQSGSMSSFKGGSNVSTAKAARAASRPSRSRGFAKRQLLNANNLSRQAAGTGKAESSAETAANAFYGGTAAGTSIEGAGVAGGLSTGRDTPPALGTEGGGAVGTPPPTCTSSEKLSADGTKCEPIVVPKTDNACKYQKELDLVKTLLMVVTILSLLAWCYAKLPLFWGIAQAMVALIGVIGAAIAFIGVQIMTMEGGDFLTGGIVTAVGAYIGYSAYMSYATASSGTVLAEFAAQSLVAGALGMMTTANAGAPKND